ncbi:MAG: alpha/beta hydrolase [Gemmatimonadetes bacterium]|nr:alpha/beta hydrolase [Gemmatimonadota bacterium]
MGSRGRCWGRARACPRAQRSDRSRPLESGSPLAPPPLRRPSDRGWSPPFGAPRSRPDPSGISKPIYEPWLRTAKSLGCPFYAFAYDWYRDNLETVEKLAAAIAAIRERHGGGPVQLVAHSMGGLVSLALLNRQPDAFVHVLFGGIPLRGGVGFSEEMHVGLPTGRNQRVSDPHMLFTCPSIYTLYPLGRLDCFAPDGSALDLDFFNPGSWVEHGIGIFADPGEATPEHLEFLGWALGRARTFREQLIHRKDAAYPPITVVASHGFPTLATAMRHGPKSVRGWDLKSMPRRPGDQRVCPEHALPPDGFEYERVENALEHGAILEDPRIPELLTPHARG